MGAKPNAGLPQAVKALLDKPLPALEWLRLYRPEDPESPAWTGEFLDRLSSATPRLLSLWVSKVVTRGRWSRQFTLPDLEELVWGFLGPWDLPLLSRSLAKSPRLLKLTLDVGPSVDPKLGPGAVVNLHALHELLGLRTLVGLRELTLNFSEVLFLPRTFELPPLPSLQQLTLSTRIQPLGLVKKAKVSVVPPQKLWPRLARQWDENWRRAASTAG